MARERVILACGDCKRRNYNTLKNKRLHPERIEFKKYCSFCDKRVMHKETR